MLHGKIHTLFRDDQASTYRGNQMIRSLQGVRNYIAAGKRIVDLD